MFGLVALLSVTAWAATSQRPVGMLSGMQTEALAVADAAALHIPTPQQPDTIVPFRVRPTVSTRAQEERRSGDLKDPENLKTGLVYDEETGTYKYGTQLNEEFIYVPYYMTNNEVQRMGLQESIRAYFRKKNREEFEAKGKEKFDFTDMKFELGPAEKIFGPGGVRVKTQGSAELKIGANHRFTDNPSLSERNRSVFGFDFNEKINLSLNGKVGDKVNMDFNYNSEATFNFDTQNLKLRYEGKEDEIIKLVEAGNVSMPTNSALIRGAQSLFGVRTDMQFGKLKLQTMMAQKKSSAQTVQSRGGVQLTNFEFSAADYDENRHFFLAHYFRDNYDAWMSQLPTILSGVTINRVEIWVTNKTGATTNTRSLLALTDLGENQRRNTTLWTAGSDRVPSNLANSAYSRIVNQMGDNRDISSATNLLQDMGLVGGEDFEKLENARLLSSSEYRLNSELGYVSLRSTLQTDQVLAVAFEYTYRGQTYQVGEFSTDRKDNTQLLLVKTLKNTACTPQMGNWDLMMRNVYALGASSVQRDKFRLDVKLLSDTTGVYLTYLPEPALKNKKLISLMGLDELDNNNKRNPNGYFDFVEGYTIDAASGRVYFPVVEPFGAHLAKVIGDPEVAKRYAYTELYDSTRTIAKQIAEHNKFVLSGEYKATKNDEIQLGASNIPRGSVVVTAGGQLLTEGSDYSVDYSSGIVKILNKSILDAGTPISCSLESNTDFGMQRKTMFGLNFQYDYSKDFQFGGTLMHLSEQPLTNKVAMGSEPLNNTIWGLNMAWKKQSQWLTNLVNRLPFSTSTAPSTINFTAEFAHLMAGSNSRSQGNASYLDDFENSKSVIDVSQPQAWMISSTPAMFPESKLSNDIRYGYNRALLAWYYIDPLFTRRSSSLTPGYIKSDLKQLSDPRVREVYMSDLYPNKSINYKEASTLSVLNMAYYPNERGPYNLDPQLDSDGRLLNPNTRWGGMMRRLETSDFQAANIEYVEFWMMDPYTQRDGQVPTYSGDLYFNLGEISEDVLKDGKKFYESGLPTDGNTALTTETVWGRVPTQSSVTYAFNTASGSRRRQDVGFNGLSSEDERTFGAYAQYLAQVQGRVRPEVYDSLLMSPSGDKYHYFRGSDWDEKRTSILDRYKYINNPNGNSVAAEDSPESYSTAYKTTPDAEDINQDYTLNEYEKYYQYRVRISPENMVVGQNYIVDMRVTYPKTRDGNTTETKWYLFRIPLNEYERREGNINDFSSIRFMRMFMTGFEEPIVLRFATLNLVRGEWRGYEQALYTGTAPDASGTLAVSAVNFEENNEKTPVNYVLPPGISRAIEPGQEQVLQNNEQALALTVKNLAGGDARAVYKNTTLDLRRYKHLQLFVHANALPDEVDLENGQMSLFLRIGSDYKNNFYEYEIPLTLTPEGTYAGTAGQRAVWPEENMIDLDLEKFTTLKRNRNRQKSLGLMGFNNLYSEYDGDRPKNKISVQGNPTLGEVRTIMIGVRNNSRATKSVEVWANELRLQEFSNKGGWAAQSQLNVQLSDLANVNLSGHVETNGFGGLEETVSQRRDNDLYQYAVTTSVEAGKLLPEKVKLTAPIYYSYSKERVVPRYNPLDTDMSMSEALDGLATAAERDSLRNITDKVVVNRNFSLSGVRFNHSTKGFPMPYDPANFTFGYSHSSRHTTGETTAWERDMNWRFNFSYSYSPTAKPFEPFKKAIKSKSKWVRVVKDFGINYLPQNVVFNSDITRNYYEMQERDIQQLDNTSLPLTFSSDFLWNRSFQLRWDPTRLIHFNLSSGTSAEIEQPYVAVNKDLFPDEYAAWKDSVSHSIRSWGRPLSYQQTAELSWTLPLNKIPALEWATADVKYNATYNWTRGAELSSGASMGHTIANQRNITANSRLNFETLYNFVPFLKKVNRKFATGARAQTKTEQKNYEKEFQLKTDTTIVIPHNQRTKRIRVTAIREDGTRYPVRFKVLDVNRIEVLSRDSVKLKFTVAPRKKAEDQTWYKALEYTSRGLMMLRNVNISYRNTYNMALPGFLPQIGDFFGQSRGVFMAPGLDFAFATAGESYIEKAAERGWLLSTDSIITPATTNSTEDLQVRATVEPIRDLKINLNFSRNVNRAQSIQYMFEGRPRTATGSFTMTTLSLRSAFGSSGNADNGYNSPTFNKFLLLLDPYRARVEKQYEGLNYPNTVSGYEGEPFDPAVGGVEKYSSDVMIPAFLNAYTGSSSLDIFPALMRMMPNWTLSYGGLSSLPSFKKWFKSFNLNHGYKSIYSVGGYNTFQSFQEVMGGLGFINNVTTGTPTPSSMYDISTVSINESFSPLLGIDMTFHNNLTAKIEYRRTRVLTLSMTSQQITEARSNDIVLGTGYRINDFNLFASKSPLKKNARSNRRGSTNSNSQTNNNNNANNRNNNSGFAHSLNLRLDFTIRSQSALQRNILTALSQATGGNRAIQLSLSADYTVSRYLTLSAYYDRQMNNPLLTSSSYPSTTQDFGVNLKFQLAR